MDRAKYRLRYLPLFYEDMAEVIDYISNDLLNPTAAHKLIDLTEQAILKAIPHNSRLTPCLNFVPSDCPKNLGKASGFRGRQRSYAEFNATDVKVIY